MNHQFLSNPKWLVLPLLFLIFPFSSFAQQQSGIVAERREEQIREFKRVTELPLPTKPKREVLPAPEEAAPPPPPPAGALVSAPPEVEITSFVFGQGVEAFQQGRMAEARGIFSSFIKDPVEYQAATYDEQVMAYYYLGLTAYLQGKYQETIEDFTNYFQYADVPDPAAMNYVALSLVAIRKPREAVRWLQRAIRESSGDLRSIFQYNLGELYFQLQLWGLALRVLNDSAANQSFWDKRSPAERGKRDYLRGVASLQLREFDQALTYLESAGGDNPAFADLARFYGGVAYFSLGDYDRAKLVLSEALAGQLPDQLRPIAEDYLYVATNGPYKQNMGLLLSYSNRYDTNVPLNPKSGAFGRDNDSPGLVLLAIPNIQLPLGHWWLFEVNNYISWLYNFDRSVQVNDFFNPATEFSLYHPFKLMKENFRGELHLRTDTPFYNTGAPGYNLFFMQANVRPELYWFMTDWWKQRFTQSTTLIDFQESPINPANNTDGTTVAGGLDEIFEWNQWIGTVGYRGFYAFKEGDNFRNYSNQVIAGITTPTLWNFQLSTMINAAWFVYPRFIGSPKRKDTRQDYLWYLTWSGKKGWGLTATFELLKNDSNQVDFTYDKFLVEGGVYYQF